MIIFILYFCNNFILYNKLERVTNPTHFIFDSDKTEFLIVEFLGIFNLSTCNLIETNLTEKCETNGFRYVTGHLHTPSSKYYQTNGI